MRSMVEGAVSGRRLKAAGQMRISGAAAAVGLENDFVGT